jgi:hypothetical protein
MAAEQHNHRIQPLNGNNYTTWSEEMKALLRSKGLWRLVDGKEMRPSTPAKEQEAWDIKLLDSWIRQLESDVRNCELQCYRAYKHTWSPMSETKEH